MKIVEDLIKKGDPVKEGTKIDGPTFKKEHLKPGKPLVLRGYANNWKATNKWTLDYFSKLKSDAKVNVLGGEYVQGDQHFATKEFGDYIEALKNGDFDNEANKTYLPALNIFNYFPELKKDTDFSLYTSFTNFNLKLAWIGPKGTISGFHADNVNNMYAQILGKKLFVLASPSFSKQMYPSTKYLPGAICSEVDANSFDQSKYPKFEDVRFSYVILNPGDVLFIPKRWWHYVESLDTSISINNFGYNKTEKYTIALFEHMKEILHRKGWYKPNNCLCHEVIDGKRMPKV